MLLFKFKSLNHDLKTRTKTKTCIKAKNKINLFQKYNLTINNVITHKDKRKLSLNNSKNKNGKNIPIKLKKISYGKMIIIFFIIIATINSHKFNSFYSEITLRIKNIGKNKIFNLGVKKGCFDLTTPDLIQISLFLFFLIILNNPSP